MIKRAFMVASLLSLSAASAAEPAKTVVATEVPSEMINRVTCVHDADTRDLEIVAGENGHLVNYTKAGETKQVGTCSTTKEKCQAIFDSIRANLEKAGYVCKT